MEILDISIGQPFEDLVLYFIIPLILVMIFGKFINNEDKKHQ